MKGERKYYIDNLRWLWIVFLIPFHGAMAWNSWEGNYIWLSKSKVLSSLVIFISPWYMPMLFVLAGMSMKYAMQRRSYGQLVVERVKKLLVPLITGILTVAAAMTFIADKYHNQYTDNFFEHYGVYLTQIGDLTGYDGKFTPAHLWFLLFLFVISLIALLVIALQKKVWPKLSFEKVGTPIIVLLFIITFMMKPIVNLGDKSLGEDLALFLIGYYVFTEEEVLKKITKYRYVYLVFMLILDVLLTYSFIWQEKPIGTLENMGNSITAWLGILAFLGIARCNFDQNNAFTRYMAARSFLIYIVHFGWLIVVQYYLSGVMQSIIGTYLASVVITLVLTLLTCEVIKKIPFIRVLFGEKGTRTNTVKLQISK